MGHGEHKSVRVKDQRNKYLLGETLSSALCRGADLGEFSVEAGALVPGGVVLVAIGGAEAARWARLERPWSRGTACAAGAATMVVMAPRRGSGGGGSGSDDDDDGDGVN